MAKAMTAIGPRAPKRPCGKCGFYPSDDGCGRRDCHRTPRRWRAVENGSSTRSGTVPGTAAHGVLCALLVRDCDGPKAAAPCSGSGAACDRPPQLSASDLIDYWFANDAGLDLRVLDDLRALRDQGVKVFLATNQENLRAQYLWNELGLRDHADGLITSADLGVAKPDPLFFDRAMLRTNADRSAHLLIDDSPPNVKAAQAFGWKALHWTGAQRLKDICVGGP